MTGLSGGPTVVSTSHFGDQAPGTAWSRYLPANVRCLPSNRSTHILEEAQCLFLEYGYLLRHQFCVFQVLLQEAISKLGCFPMLVARVELVHKG
jgi:hypothetical protein